jgi:hypothetical protein
MRKRNVGVIKLRGWRGELDIEKVKPAIGKSSVGVSLWRRAAWALLSYTGDVSDIVMSEYASDGYIKWLESRGRWVIKEIVKSDPEKYGLVRINPNEINEAMTTKELLAFCCAGKKNLSELIAGAPENGLPKPSKKLGRTLKGRSYIFPVEVAREYAKRLIA